MAVSHHSWSARLCHIQSLTEIDCLLFTLMVAGLMGSCGSLAATAWPQKIIPHLYIISSGKSKIQDPNYGVFVCCCCLRQQFCIVAQASFELSILPQPL